MADPFAPIEQLMRAEGLPEPAIRAFARHHAMALAGDTGQIGEAEIEPVPDLPDAEQLPGELAEAGRAALPQAVVIKLNGGLGTSMGLDRAKSLLPIRDELTFLDLIARQALHTAVPLLLMNSFATRDDSLRALAAYPELSGGLPRDFVQHKVPKLDPRTMLPVQWPDPSLCWCPPGHGDLFTAIATSGALEALLVAGRRYAFVSNSDNLGALLDERLLGWFVANELPFVMEVCDRTPTDRKGGHLAARGDQLVLRERAQCPDDEEEAFQDIARHRYFNSNNLWIDLLALQRELDLHDGVLPLPLIRNRKTVDPADPRSPLIYQLESAMGAAIAVFEGARAIRVPRSRFAAVKTTSDLLRIRSDATRLTEDHRLVPGQDPLVLIDLDPTHYGMLGDFERHFESGPPSLVGCRRLRVEGEVFFGRGVCCQGAVTLRAPPGASLAIPDDEVLGSS